MMSVQFNMFNIVPVPAGLSPIRARGGSGPTSAILLSGGSESVITMIQETDSYVVACCGKTQTSTCFSPAPSPRSSSRELEVLQTLVFCFCLLDRTPHGILILYGISAGSLFEAAVCACLFLSPVEND